jgi:hypothetical protein
MSDFVFARYMDDTFKASKNINNYFDKFDIYNSNVYQILNQIPQHNLVTYIFIASVVFFILQFYQIELKHLLSFFLVILILGYLIQKDFGDFNQYVSVKKNQLKFLNKLCFDGKLWRNFGPNNDMNIMPKVQESYLYRNPLIVEFFYNIREYSQYNLSAYVDSILHVNNIIYLHQQIIQGLQDPFSNLDVAKEEMSKSLNHLQSMIYKIPDSNVTNQKYKKSLDILQSILTRYIIEIEIQCERKNKKVGYHVLSKPDDQLNSSFDVPANDTNTRDYNPSFNLYVE